MILDNAGIAPPLTLSSSTEVPQSDQHESESGYGSFLHGQPEYQDDLQALPYTGDAQMIDITLTGSFGSFEHHLNPLAGVGEGYIDTSNGFDQGLLFDPDGTMPMDLDALTLNSLDADVRSDHGANLILPVRDSNLGSSAYEFQGATVSDKEQFGVLSAHQPTASRQGIDTGSWQERIVRHGEDDETHRKLPNGNHQCTICKKIVKRPCDIR